MDFLKNKKLKLANSYLVSSISITFVLLTLAFFALLLLNTKDISRGAKESISISVILIPDVENQAANELLQTIMTKDYCKSAQLITPDEALEDLKMAVGDDVTDILDFNPLPMTINLNAQEEYSNTDSLQLLKTKLKQNQIVEDVFYNKTLVYQLDKNVKNLSLLIGILEFFLLLMAFALINNTIRLMVFSKRFEIKTMQLVGATSFFITKPFIIKSLLQGLFCSLITIAILIASILYYQNNVNDIIQIKHLEAVFGIILLAGVVLTTASTFISVNKFLTLKSEELY